jgi:hypothetical protein
VACVAIASDLNGYLFSIDENCNLWRNQQGANGRLQTPGLGVQIGTGWQNIGLLADVWSAAYVIRRIGAMVPCRYSGSALQSDSHTHRCQTMLTRICLALAGVATITARGLSQPAAAQNVVSLHLACVSLRWCAAEYERAPGETSFTWGVGVSHLRTPDEQYSRTVSLSAADLKLRYYLGDNALRGVSFGIAVGLSRWARTDDANAPDPLSGPTSAMVVEYQRIAASNFTFAVGVGFKVHHYKIPRNVAPGTPYDHSRDITGGYPTLRLSFGRAF